MGPRIGSLRDTTTGVEQVRARLLTALHLGHYKPGDRAPSIRRMATLTHLNRKTVHRAYARLAEEGLLETRWGSGTYFSQTQRPAPTHDPLAASLVEAVERCRVEANHLGVPTDVFLRFLGLIMGGRLRGTPVAIAECNREQIGLIERELSAALGVTTYPMVIADALTHHPSWLSSIRAVITTDCHRREVTEMMSPFGLPVFRVGLAPDFTNTLIRSARRGPLLMVVRDATFGHVFLRMLRQLQVPREVIEHFEIVAAEELGTYRRRCSAGAVHVSPLVDDLDAELLRGLERVRTRNYLAPASLEAVKVHLALELAMSARLPA